MNGATITAQSSVRAAAFAGPPPAERRILWFLVGSLALYTLALLPAVQASDATFVSTLHGFLVVSFFFGCVIALGDAILRQRRANTAPFSLRDIIWYAVAAAITGMTIPVYGIFKQMILAPRGFPLDPILAKLDRALFLGHDPWTLTHKVLGSVDATMAIDAFYSSWMGIMFIVPLVIVALVKNGATRGRLLGCWMFAWIIVGNLAAWLFASAGPCYYGLIAPADPGMHRLALESARLAAEAQARGLVIHAFDFQPMLWKAHLDGTYYPAGGISAMPSMHVTMSTFFVIAGFQIRRWLGWAMVVFASTVWIGSIHLGWHYASDGIVAAAMMIAIWRASGWLVKRFASDGADTEEAAPAAE